MPDNAAIYATSTPHLISVEKLRAFAPGAAVAAKQSLFGVVSQFTVTTGRYTLTLNVMPGKDIPAHIAGFVGYIPHISQGHQADEIAEFSAKVQGVHQVLGCVIEPGFDAGDDCRRFIDAVARACDGMIFLDNSVHDTATGEKWLPPDLQQREVEVALARKRRSEAILRREGVPYIEHLPRIETEVTMRRRTVEEVAWRAMAVGLAAVKGEGLEQPRVLEVLARYQLEPHLTPAERRFLLNDSPSDLDRTNFTWKYEGYWVLLWALGFVEDLGRPDHTCDVPTAVRVMVERTPQQFLADARRRDFSRNLRRRRPRLPPPLGRHRGPPETDAAPGGPRSGRRLRAPLCPELAHRLRRRLGPRPHRHLTGDAGRRLLGYSRER